jgi:hypothetical protein
MKLDNKTWMYILIGILIIIGVWIFSVQFKLNKEHYGGPVKKIRRIPRTTCHDICAQYYRDCLVRYGHNDAGDCVGRYQRCIATCDYTDFHRL